MRSTLLCLALLLLFSPFSARATEDYAQATEQGCSICHTDPAGGGALTAAGTAYAAGGYRWPPAAAPAAPPTLAVRAARTALGLLHLLAAFAWFGTIFYVHLVLRPAYAKGGLPRTEARIAWGSILLLALTGVPLLFFRYPDLSAIAQSRSGVLLLVKIGLYLFLVLSAAFVTLRLSPRLKRLRTSWQMNDGREGRPAWVKVDERLYDVTGSPRWKEGLHFNRHQAGQDLSKSLENAPHGPEVLTRMRSFTLEGGSLALETSDVALLYVLAYVNLFVALGIIVTIALRHWG